MKRRNFLKALGIGVLSSGVAIDLLQRAEPVEEFDILGFLRMQLEKMEMDIKNQLAMDLFTTDENIKTTGFDILENNGFFISSPKHKWKNYYVCTGI